MKPMEFILCGPIAFTLMICETIDRIFLFVSPPKELPNTRRKEKYTLPTLELIEGGRHKKESA